MKVVCAWCSKEISTSQVESDVISHGMCGLCRRNYFGETWISFEELMRGAQFPVIFADRDMRVAAASEAAAAAFAGSAHGGSKLLAGVVIGCVNSQLPGGCGQSTECAGCVLRNTATATFADGQTRNGVTSVHRLDADGGVRDVQIVFSVERTGAGVLLFIEAVRDCAAVRDRFGGVAPDGAVLGRP